MATPMTTFLVYFLMVEILLSFSGFDSMCKVNDCMALSLQRFLLHRKPIADVRFSTIRVHINIALDVSEL